MLRAILALLALALPTALAAQVPLPVHSGGRVVRDGEGWRFGWPGIYFEGRFSGTEVTVAVESATEHFRVLIDGVEKAVIAQPGTARLTLTGLAPGEHVVRVEKITESQQGAGRFLGFWTTDGGTALPPRPRARRIEFIGDSYSAGYGNASHGRTCTRAEVHDLTDTGRAFGPLVANRLGADYRVNAYSGHGMVRNYGGSSPDSSLPLIYDRMIPGEAEGLFDRRDNWRPQLIVIALGANDFSTPLHEGERWPDQAALMADWHRTYLAFVRMLMARQPQARFLLMGRDPWFAELERIAAELSTDPRRPVLTLRYPEMALDGCDYHPGLADHRLFADALEARIEGIARLWD